jgi:predicted RNA methylase
MFDTITKKLTDHNFIQSAIELSAEVEEKGKSASKSTANKKAKAAGNTVSS